MRERRGEQDTYDPAAGKKTNDRSRPFLTSFLCHASRHSRSLTRTSLIHSPPLTRPPFRLRSSLRPSLRARTGSLHSAEWNGESVTSMNETYGGRIIDL